MKVKDEKGTVKEETPRSAAAASPAGPELITLTFKPGQKKETPPPASGTRVFYESLYKENPDSFMALKWCIEYGVVSTKNIKDAIKKLDEKKAEMKEKEKQRKLLGSPRKSSVLQKALDDEQEEREEPSVKRPKSDKAKDKSKPKKSGMSTKKKTKKGVVIEDTDMEYTEGIGTTNL